jgi:hypothetical protein
MSPIGTADPLSTVSVEVHRVGAEEVMPGISVELGSLATCGGVLDREAVQS